MSTYPNNPNLPQGTNSTAVNTTNWNALIDNINAIGADLVDARGDGQTFPGTPHTAGQCGDIDDILQAIKHLIADISGETNWYNAPSGSLKSHNHTSGQGGLIPWSSLGSSNSRKLEIHPQYQGAVITSSLRGASPSGNNTITISPIIDVVSYIGRHCYEGVSNQPSLQDYYVAFRWTLPIDFGSWAVSNAIQIEYRTNSALSSDCHVDVYVYKSGSGSLIASSENNVNVNWSNISISGSALGTWVANDIIEIYLKFESRNNNYARVGKITLNYNA
ncbi:TPA: hypothetical protein ENX78_13475 [Candidatus Poribacteria bacterium]|nr:hypothetical protein [Candidatus Poribacteria bacterium]